MLERFALKPISAIEEYGMIEGHLDKVIEEAKALGVQFIGTSGISRQGTLTAEDVKKAAAVFNRAGETLAKAGIKFFYHPHGFEFVPQGDGTLFDLLMTETDPKWVSFEMDIFWVVHPGQDPVKLLQRYPNRWALMHIKDMRKGTKTGLLTGSEDVRNDVRIGSGQIDVPAALRAAARVGVQHYFIEDESAVSTEQIPQSLRFLESLAW
jgi:sugar phosphate isomerase/epimerase